MNLIKNISKSEVHVLKDQVTYQEGQVVSKTLAQNDAVSITLFAFDLGEIIGGGLVDDQHTRVRRRCICYLLRWCRQNHNRWC